MPELLAPAASRIERAFDAAGRWSQAFARTIADHLEDGDVAVRTLAVVLCAHAAVAVGAATIAQTLERAAPLFEGVKPVGHPTHQPDLRWTLLVALGRAVGPGDGAAIRTLRQAAGEARGYWLLDALARVDRAWLLDHARDVVPMEALGGTLIGMPDTAARQALIRALAPWTDAERRAGLEAPFWTTMPDAARVRPVLEEQ